MNLVTKTALIVLTLLFLPFLASAATIGRPMHNAGLVGYWALDDGAGLTASDRSGNSNTGTLTNMDASTDWVSGKYGGALDFDSDNDYVDTTYSTITSSITISTWINPRSNGEGNLGRIIDRNTTDVVVLHLDASGNVCFYRGFDTNDGKWCTTAGPTVSNNEFQHIAVTYNDSSTANDPIIYVNGESKAISESQTPSGSVTTNTDNYLIGNRGDTLRTFDGVIDEVRIYSRILSAAEIERLSNLGRPRFGVSPRKLLTNGLVSYWTFDGSDIYSTTVFDSTTNSNDGTLSGNPTATFGRIGQALDFDGTDDLINMGDQASLDMGTSDFSVSAWVKISSSPTYTNPTIIVKGGTDGSTAGYWFNLPTAGPKLQMSDGASTFSFDGASNLQDDTWHHVVAVADRDGSGSIYVDGVLDGTADDISSRSADSIDTNQNFSVGGRQVSSDLEMTGIIDDVRVYDRTLSANEISKLYNASRPAQMNKTRKERIISGLVGHWTFDGSNTFQSTTTDSSGNGNDGTLTNGAGVGIGRIGQGVKLDGSDDYVRVSTTNFSASAGTVSAWIKADSFSSDVDYIFGHTTIPSFASRIQIYTDDTGGNLDLGLGDNHSRATGIQDLETGVWYHVALTWDGSNYVVYVDSVSKSSGAYTGMSGIHTSADIGNHGDTSDGSDQSWDGIIDDVRVYNRALSADEIEELYNMGR